MPLYYLHLHLTVFSPQALVVAFFQVLDLLPQFKNPPFFLVLLLLLIPANPLEDVANAVVLRLLLYLFLLWLFAGLLFFFCPRVLSTWVFLPFLSGGVVHDLGGSVGQV